MVRAGGPKSFTNKGAGGSLGVLVTVDGSMLQKGLYSRPSIHLHPHLQGGHFLQKVVRYN